MTVSFSFPRPYDLHVHFRDDVRTMTAIGHTTSQFAGAIVMPNLVPPVVSVEDANKYLSRLRSICDTDFRYMMTLYMTETTTLEDITKISEHDDIYAIKLYPAGATTNADSGVTRLDAIDKQLVRMQELDIPLLLHGESIDSDVDIFDREKAFLDTHMKLLVERYPHLRIVMEHITTKDAVDFITQAGDNICATVTPQHMLVDRSALFEGNKIRPHNFCLPILKKKGNREAIVQVVLSGNSKFFAGTDSAPHLQSDKESACGCAGCYTACNAVELYAQVFDQEADLTNPNTQKILSDFMSKNGADFYRVPVSSDTITITQSSYTIPDRISLPDDNHIIPFWAGKKLLWSIKN